VFIHTSFEHLFANVLLTLSMSLLLETKYGFWRIALVWFMSCLGGQMLSATTEDPCSHVVGASGGVFGMIGLFVADMVVNFQTIKRPLLRCLAIFCIIVAFTSKLVVQVRRLIRRLVTEMTLRRAQPGWLVSLAAHLTF
jgi:membrane associated rhomboid family serine protease